MMETRTEVATMRARVAADDWCNTEEGSDNEHDETMRHDDGPVPTLTPVHQRESSSLAPDAG